MDRGLTGRGALMLWIDVDSALRAETDTWYAVEHLPDRVGEGGYLRARRYRALSAANEYLTFFVAETPEALASPGYLGLVRQISPQSHRIRAGFRNVARNTFRFGSSRSLGTGGVAATWRLPLGAALPPAVTLEALAAAQGVVAVHALAAAPDIRQRMDAVRVTGLDDAQTGSVVLVEALQEDDLPALRTILPAAGCVHETWRLQHDLAR